MNLCAAALRLALGMMLGVALAGCRDAPPRRELTLFTSLPIYWPEGDVGDMLSGDVPVHWARAALEERYKLVPIDRLTDLAPGGLLLMAQPRALAPDENVALDNWVRAGGKLVLLADPMLDVDSRYGLGDRRRPVATAMLSPILARWGLAVAYEPGDRGAIHAQKIVRWKDFGLLVEEAGTLMKTGEGYDSRCWIEAKGVVASCKVGKGNVIIVADATFLADGDHAGKGAHGLLIGLLYQVHFVEPYPK